MANNYDVLECYLKDNYLGLSPKTLITYKYQLQIFFKLVGDLPLEDIKKKHIRAWESNLFEQGHKPRTVRLALYSLRSFFNYCKEEDLIKIDPTLTIDLPTPEQTIPQIIDKPDIFKIREVLKGNFRDRAIFEVLYVTGVRVSELTNIKIEDLHLLEGRIDIPDGKGLKERFVLFTDDCSQRISQYLATRTDTSPYLFITRHFKPFTTQGIRKVLHSYSTLADLRAAINPHDLRRTYATTLYKNGVPIEHIAKLMGHVSIATTLMYTNLTKTKGV